MSTSDDGRRAVDWSSNVGAGEFSAEAGGVTRHGHSAGGAEDAERAGGLPDPLDSKEISPGTHGRKGSRSHDSSSDRAGSGRDRKGKRPKARTNPSGSGSGEEPANTSIGADVDADADPDAVARSICLRLLTGAPKTRAQLADTLRRKQVPDDVAGRVLDRLVEVGLVDDAAFAEAWVQSRHTGRGLARRALRSELRQRGVDDETTNEALEILDPGDELETARGLVRRRLPSTRRLQPATRFRRLAGMLARKGYSGGLAARVVKEELAAEDDDIGELPDLDGPEDD